MFVSRICVHPKMSDLFTFLFIFWRDNRAIYKRRCLLLKIVTIPVRGDARNVKVSNLGWIHTFEMHFKMCRSWQRTMFISCLHALSEFGWTSLRRQHSSHFQAVQGYIKNVVQWRKGGKHCSNGALRLCPCSAPVLLPSMCDAMARTIEAKLIECIAQCG